MNCEHLLENQCKFVEPVIGIALPTTSEICSHCLSCSKPKQLNKATGSLMAGYLLQNNRFDDRDPVHAEIKQILLDPVLTRGPGTELKKLISWFPVPNKTKCRACRNLELKMNRWGPVTCEAKMNYILGKLEIAAKRRSIPFSQSLATTLVRKAIRNASK